MSLRSDDDNIADEDEDAFSEAISALASTSAAIAKRTKHISVVDTWLSKTPSNVILLRRFSRPPSTRILQLFVIKDVSIVIGVVDGLQRMKWIRCGA
jgi:hypothetical protein